MTVLNFDINTNIDITSEKLAQAGQAELLNILFSLDFDIADGRFTKAVVEMYVSKLKNKPAFANIPYIDWSAVPD